MRAGREPERSSYCASLALVAAGSGYVVVTGVTSQVEEYGKTAAHAILRLGRSTQRAGAPYLPLSIAPTILSFSF
jgi:hypothetical protein